MSPSASVRPSFFLARSLGLSFTFSDWLLRRRHRGRGWKVELRPRIDGQIGVVGSYTSHLRMLSYVQSHDARDDFRLQTDKWWRMRARKKRAILQQTCAQVFHEGWWEWCLLLLLHPRKLITQLRKSFVGIVGRGQGRPFQWPYVSWVTTKCAALRVLPENDRWLWCWRKPIRTPYQELC